MSSRVMVVAYSLIILAGLLLYSVVGLTHG
ncbi:MAG: hypothetical protein AVDCRST_MAG67-1241 [uncultured Solirubrobacteraceae bacterium]|uniref:Uncharacterized protein n=1 Tax=uncultured Solirubrobacteraceae bacterium TaxID=1162706 RepID=A0A6J4S4H3_9ACTN|nr:MAG: hypothetical protein AVDCRST_MAG67-1241 [uncultured Solirubrobacteraceae bacterium]